MLESTHDVVNGTMRRDAAGRRIGRQMARVRYNGIDYDRDLVMCRRALTERQVAGDIHRMVDAALEARVSRSTLSRFFSGFSVSMRATLGILRVLRLEFAEVHTVVREDAR